MLLDELIKINKIVFGVDEPMISYIRPLPTNPILLDGSNYENKFVYTGVSSCMVIKEISISKFHYVPFEDYICLGDFPSLLGSNFEIVSIIPQYRFMSGFALSGNGLGDLIYQPLNNENEIDIVRAYLLTYQNTKLLMR